jgi:hypothetical protein
MTTYSISAGKHYDNRLLSSFPRLGKLDVTQHVRFHQNCAYQLPPYNQDDVNKLFGFQAGVKIWKDYQGQWDGGNHWNSARFGWRWSLSAQKIQLLAYCYVRGIRNWDEQMRFPVVAQLSLDEVGECRIEVTPTHYVFHVTTATASTSLVVAHAGDLPRYGVSHSLFFGGSLPAPHDMDVDMSSSPL